MTHADIDPLIDGTLAVEGGVGNAAALPFRPGSIPPPPPTPGRGQPSYGGLPFHSTRAPAPYVPPSPLPPPPPMVAQHAIAPEMPQQGPIALAAIHASAAGMAPQAPRVELAHDRGATLGVDSALGASNAAAGRDAAKARIIPESYRRPRGASVELIWIDEAAYVQPSRQHTAETYDLADEFLEPAAAPVQDHTRTRAASTLSRGEVTSGCDLVHRHDDAMGGIDRFVALVEGEIEMRFEPAQASKVLMALTAQLATVDARIKSAHDFASQPGVDLVPSLAIGHEQRLREAITHQPRETRSFIEGHAERALLETRAYDKRTVFGGTFVVATYVPSDGTARLPIYIPEGAVKDLPLMRRFPLRAVVEVRCKQESGEAAPIALRALALGRVAAVASSA